MNPDDFKGFNLPHSNAEERENARVVKNLLGAPDLDQSKPWPWYYFVLTGLACAAGMAWLHYDISSAEQQDQAIRLPRLVAFAYELLGKWPTTALLATLSASIIGVGIWSLIAPNDATKKQSDAGKPAK